MPAIVPALEPQTMICAGFICHSAVRSTIKFIAPPKSSTAKVIACCRAEENSCKSAVLSFLNYSINPSVDYLTDKDRIKL